MLVNVISRVNLNGPNLAHMAAATLRFAMTCFALLRVGLCDITVAGHEITHMGHAPIVFGRRHELLPLKTGFESAIGQFDVAGSAAIGYVTLIMAIHALGFRRHTHSSSVFACGVAVDAGDPALVM